MISLRWYPLLRVVWLVGAVAALGLTLGGLPTCFAELRQVCQAKALSQ